MLLGKVVTIIVGVTAHQQDILCAEVLGCIGNVLFDGQRVKDSIGVFGI